MSLFLDLIEYARQLRIVRRPICLNSAKITVYYWLKLILSGCCSSKCGIAMNIPKLCSWLPSPLFLDVLRIPCDQIGFCIFGRCWRWDVFEVAMNGCGRSEALPCDRVLWLAAGPHLLQPHTLPNHLMTTPPQPNQPPVLPHGHAQVKICSWSGNLPGWGVQGLFWVSGAFEGWLLSADARLGRRRPFGHGCRGMPAMSQQCRSASPPRQEHMTPHNVCV